MFWVGVCTPFDFGKHLAEQSFLFFCWTNCNYANFVKHCFRRFAVVETRKGHVSIRGFENAWLGAGFKSVDIQVKISVIHIYKLELC